MRAGGARWIASDSADFLGIHRESRIQFLSSLMSKIDKILKNPSLIEGFSVFSHPEVR